MKRLPDSRKFWSLTLWHRCVCPLKVFLSPGTKNPKRNSTLGWPSGRSPAGTVMVNCWNLLPHFSWTSPTSHKPTLSKTLVKNTNNVGLLIQTFSCHFGEKRLLLSGTGFCFCRSPPLPFWVPWFHFLLWFPPVLGGIAWWLKVLTLELDCLVSNPSYALYQLCDAGQIA